MVYFRLLLPFIVCTVFVVISLWHFYMATFPSRGESGAVPSSGGKPLFVPFTGSTLAVAVVLLLFAGLVAGTGDMLPLPLPRRVLVWLCYGLAAGLAVRAVGDFRYVGFFKRVRGTRFATMDTWVYSPVCLLLSAGVALVASWNH